MPAGGFAQLMLQGLAVSVPMSTSLAKNSTWVTGVLVSTPLALAFTVRLAGAKYLALLAGAVRLTVGAALAPLTVRLRAALVVCAPRLSVARAVRT